jgi:hypothetical protein
MPWAIASPGSRKRRLDRPRLGLGRADHGLGQFRPSGADQPGQRQHLARAHLEADIREFAATRQTIHAHQDVAGGLAMRRIDL